MLYFFKFYVTKHFTNDGSAVIFSNISIQLFQRTPLRVAVSEVNWESRRDGSFVPRKQSPGSVKRTVLKTLKNLPRKYL